MCVFKAQTAVACSLWAQGVVSAVKQSMLKACNYMLFSLCVVCSQSLKRPLELREQTVQRAKERLKIEGLNRDPALRPGRSQTF